MALIIKGDMPKYGCANLVDGKLCDITSSCPAWKRYFGTEQFHEECVNHFPSDCPILGEIPDEHGDLKDVNVIEDMIINKFGIGEEKYVTPEIYDILLLIKKAPTVVKASI